MKIVFGFVGLLAIGNLLAISELVISYCFQGSQLGE